MKGRRENNKRRLPNQNPTASEKKPKYYGDRNPDPIPLDLMMDIFSRLPVKTLVRFTCVSKLWSSIIRSREFVNLFLARSSTRPRLLANYPSFHHRDFFSSRDLQQLTVPEPTFFSVSKAVNGLVYKETFRTRQIYNPATEQFVTLPTQVMETRPPGYSLRLKNFFAYDPIDDQYKVLCVMLYKRGKNERGKNKRIMEYQIFVLGENAWRRIQNAQNHITVTDCFCINGIMYYGARTFRHNERKIVAFNVKHETFKFISIPADQENSFLSSVTLIDFEGKLALVDYRKLVPDNTFKVWVLEDDTNGEWSEKSYVLPSSWRDFFIKRGVRWVGDFNLTSTIYTDEIIIMPKGWSGLSFVLYYNMKTNSLRRAEIKPNHEFTSKSNYVLPFVIFTEYVKSIKLLDGFKRTDHCLPGIIGKSQSFGDSLVLPTRDL